MKSLAQMSGEKTARDAIAVIRSRICATDDGQTVEMRSWAQRSGRDDFTAANVIRLARPLARSFRVAWSLRRAAALVAVINDSPGRVELRDLRWGRALPG